MKRFGGTSCVRLEGSRIYVMKMEVAISYETVANCDQTARCRNTEDDTDIDIDIFVNCNWVVTRWQ